MERCTCSQANDWYAKQPWFRGCNYLPSDCVNRIDMWQSYECEKHFETAARELAVMESIGFNSIRVILEFLVWKEEHDSFMERFERFLALADARKIKVMVCFGNDCTVPKNAHYRPPHLGKQECDWGYHSARKYSPQGSFPDEVGCSLLDDPETAERFYGMVREIVMKYRTDPRICVWDLFNEPGNNNRGAISVPHVQKVFDTARACDPVQPLTSGIWHFNPANLNPAEKLCLELSDVISYHNYGYYADNVVQIDHLRKFGRPLLNTEWLNRISHNTIQECFPLFFLEKVSCWNWGFVAGLNQTYEPYEAMWKAEERGEADLLDFTKWQHDLFRPSLRPYDPKEIKIIRRFCELADRNFAEEEK